ncbi:acetyltransferase [Roseobacter sp. HKCCD5988]|uniref:acetyltransferase n=1 Tax=Roseobacter sp. HKCCD5988 TaxID=3120338 RepID=UPI0030EF3FF5
MNVINENNVKNIILGAGSHAHALMMLLRECDMKVFGCVAPSPPETSRQDTCRWLGNDDVLKQFDQRSTYVFNGIGSTGSTSLRQAIFKKNSECGFRFGSIVHPTAIIANDVMLSQGVQMFPGVIIQHNVKIAEDVLLNTGCIIEHDCTIGAHSHVAPGAVLSGGVIIGEGVHVGASSVVAQGVCIGNNAIIGIGAVVIRDVPENTIAIGNPARAYASNKVKSQ